MEAQEAADIKQVLVVEVLLVEVLLEAFGMDAVVMVPQLMYGDTLCTLLVVDQEAIIVPMLELHQM